jgi:DNA mismatch repair ATPase MutS
MKAFLMHRGRDFDLGQELPWNEAALTRDLGLERLFEAMALKDKFLFDVVRKALLSTLKDPGEITYRQHALDDCMRHPAVVRGIYTLAVEAMERERKVFRSFFFRSPDAVLHGSVEALKVFVEMLRRLRAVADEHAGNFRSEAFAAFFEMVQRELDDAYLASVEDHLRELRFPRGALISARLGKGNKGADYVLRRARRNRQSWKDWIRLFDRSSIYTIVIPPRDDNGFRALTELKDRGINRAANAVAQSADHLSSFFAMLRAELGFYIGCLNLWTRLRQKGEPVCFPEPLPAGRPRLAARGLYDVGLSLSMDGRVVGNDIDADGKGLVMITGANQGGKSTFLRSVGLAQMMMQCGMFVGAEALRGTVCDALFTHYKREEDPTMKSGKLDEELSRMSEIADRLTPNTVVLLNESFAATNEREGAEIAGAIVRALLDAGVRVFFVTHSFELANGLYGRERETALFLRAERRPDGTRTFRVVEGRPLPTSYGADLYERIFGQATRTAAAAEDGAAGPYLGVPGES